MAVPVLDPLKVLIERARKVWRQAREEAGFRVRHPDAILSDGVLLFDADQISAGQALFIDRHAYLIAGWLQGRRGRIRIGDNVEIGPYSVLWGHGGITIGSNVHIGAHVSITAHEARQVRPERTEVMGPLEFDFGEVVIEDHVLVCSGTQIIPGVRIGHHSMIGAGAVVVADIPPYTLAVGCPAKPIRSLKPEIVTLRAVTREAM